MVSPYDERTETTRSRIIGNRQSYIPNKYYKSSEGNFYYYINTKGYFHCIKFCKIKYDGKFSHYEIRDLLLNRDDTVKEIKSYGYFKTKEDAIESIEKNLA